MASALASAPLPFAGSPRGHSHSRPSSSSSSRLNQAQQPPPPSDLPGGYADRRGRTSDSPARAEQSRSVQRGTGGTERDETSQGGGVGSTRGSADSTSNPSIPSQYHSAITSPVSHSHRPSSAESTDSSSRYRTISSPHSQQYSFPSSSISSNIGGQAAFDYDDLLGPRPQPGGSSASISPPSSEDDKLRTVGGARLQGLGFTSSPRVRAGKAELGAGGGGGGLQEWYGEGESDDHWLHAHSSTRLATALPTPPTSSPPSHPTSIPGAKTRQASNTTSGSGGVGSPLSPLVAPFSPGGGAVRPGGSPWATATSSTFGTREREPSHNAPSTTFFPTSSYASPTTQRHHTREPTFPTPHGSTPVAPRLAGDMLSPAAFHAAHSSPCGASGFTPKLQQHDSVDSPYPPTGLFAPPPVSQPMSEASSRDGPFLHRKELSVDKGGYIRSGFPDRGGYNSGISSANGSFKAALQPPPPGTAGSVSGAESVNSSDEISTIFVVGFPDDMQEREFQNMFLFAEGFEAATLKVPAPPTTAVTREWEKEFGGTSSTGGSDAGHGPSSSIGVAGGGGNGDDSSGEQPALALPPYLNPASSASAKDPFAALRESASSPLSGFTSASSANGASTPISVNGGGRKQTIGFARFATRQQALEAKEMLTGKRVDTERGSVLKAEMAKKNLHTRKVGTTLAAAVSAVEAQITPLVGGLGTPLLVASSSSPALAPSTSFAAPPVPTTTTATTTSPTSNLPPGSGPSIPLSVLDPKTRASIANTAHINPAVLAEIARQSMAAASLNRAAQAPPAPPGASDLDSRSAFDAFHSVPPQGPLVSPIARRDVFGAGGGGGADEYGSRESLTHFGPGGVPLSPSMSDSSISPPQHQATLFSAYAASGRGLPPPHHLQAAQQEDYGRPPPQPLFGSSGSGGSGSIAGLDPSLLPSSSGRDRQASFPSFGPGASGGGGGGGLFGSPLPAGQTPRQQVLNNPLASPPLGGGGGGGGAYGSPSLGAIPRTQNPADMNAPKNTLYVGGLPAVLPSLTGPFSASHLEDSLRNAFSRCPGFKRLQFRSKSNGPIVFVEFVDTAHATRAMQELYGHTLGGLVKGGIRLSYSKNPLGVRSNGLPSAHSPSMSPPNALEPQTLSSGFGPSSTFAGPPPVGPSPFDPPILPYDPHRRPPDPIYGETGYNLRPPPLPLHQQQQQQQYGPPAFARSPPMTSPLEGGPPPHLLGGGSGGGSAGASTPSYGGFSPFGLEGP